MASPTRPHPLKLAALASAMLLSPWAVAADGHAAPAAAAPAKPAVIKPAPVAAPAAHAAAPAAPAKPMAEAPTALPADELARRLQERIARVRAAQAQAQKAKPAGGHHGSKPAHAAAPAVKMGIVSTAAHAPDGHGASDVEPTAHAAHVAHWSYGGEGGPAEWGKLRPDFSTCAKGQRQSPIDIRGGVKVDLEPIKFNYRSTGFNVLDNGHTVQANLGYGNSIEVAGRRYDLVQFHFHRPSEERINGRQFDMVAHLVHKDPEGRLAVVAVLMDQGKQHPMVQLVWNSLPLEKNDELQSPVPLDMNLMLPEDRRYYTYMGSLTTPPCSEGVLWLVLKQPAQLSADQLAVFTKLYPMNARPIQQASGRMVKESN
ncbi:carbonic anhydrase family protein [Sphaerotilus sp.]|uniref:carbonic anhydrase n=1 Tax=Sphaerotilus sp. TaxID=2093942 RepID=UPI002ACE5972|nr:carbonic anhydrase family protein [Sphaerotilus sp.]MDZ7858689.1 carbonic anhydrase family protein [Sphaerotilus sp.]